MVHSMKGDSRFTLKEFEENLNKNINIYQFNWYNPSVCGVEYK